MKPVTDTNAKRLNLTLSSNGFGNTSTTNVSMGGTARNCYQTTANTTKSPVINETTMSEMKAIFANSPNNTDGSKIMSQSQTLLLSNRKSSMSNMGLSPRPFPNPY